MKFLQQLDPLVETHETAIADNLEESSVIRTLDQLRKYTIRDIADFAFLHFMILFIMQTDEDLAVAAAGHARRVLAIGDFKKLTLVGTDLYVYLHLLFGHNKDRLKHTPHSDLFFKRFNLTEREVRSMLQDMANGRTDEGKRARFMLSLEKNLQIDTANYRSCRRFVAYWNEQELYNQKLVVTRILLSLRSRTPTADLLVHLESFAKTLGCDLKKNSLHETETDCDDESQ